MRVHARVQADVQYQHVRVAGGAVPQSGIPEKPFVVVFVRKVFPMIFRMQIQKVSELNI